MNSKIINEEEIAYKIFMIRGEKMMLDRDLAELYGVETKALKQAVKRNIKRFPQDFMIELTMEEYKYLRSQFVTLKRGEHSKYKPYAFTEQGIAMLSGILNSDQAVMVNIAIMRTFVQLRKWIFQFSELDKKVNELDQKFNDKLSIIYKILEKWQPPARPEEMPEIGYKQRKKNN